MKKTSLTTITTYVLYVNNISLTLQTGIFFFKFLNPFTILLFTIHQFYEINSRTRFHLTPSTTIRHWELNPCDNRGEVYLCIP